MLGWRATTPETVQFRMFMDVSPNGKDLAAFWHQSAKGDVQDLPDPVFVPFMQLWVGFNNWAMLVTEADKDFEMINRLAESPSLKKAFATALTKIPSFDAMLQLFPISGRYST